MLPMNYIQRDFVFSDPAPTVSFTVTQGENPLDPTIGQCYYEHQISYIDPQNSFISRFDCGVSHKPAGYTITGRVRPQLVFEYCLAGSICYNGHILGPGDFIVVEPYHCFNSVAEQGGENGFWCCWEGDILGPVAEKLKKFNSETVYHLGMDETVCGMFNAVIYNRDYASIDLNGYILGFTNQLLALLPAVENRSGDNSTPLVRRAIAIIEREYRTITVEALAKQLYVAPSHLSRAFHRETGIPPKQYITRTRLTSAIYYLTSTEYSLQKIAEMLGYTNYTNFYSAFRQRFGMSPDAYRRLYTQRE